MSVVAQVAAVAAVLVHLLVWVWEAFLLHRVHHSVFRIPAGAWSRCRAAKYSWAVRW